MEFLNSVESEMVARATCDHRAQVAYIFAIKRLTRLTEINTNICAMIRSLFDDLMKTLKESDVQVVELGNDYKDVFSSLRALVLDLTNLTHVGQDLLNTRHDLLLGLSAAQKEWGKGDMSETDLWFDENAEIMQKLASMYDEDIAKNSRTLNQLECFTAQIWLAISHSKELHGRIK